MEKSISCYPPFLSERNEKEAEETKETNAIAKVRIHIERIMQRLRLCKILDFISQHLFDVIDEIFHMTCVLVNLQPPMI